MATHHELLHPTKTLILSRPFHAISPLFPVLSLSVDSSSCLSSSSFLNPIRRKESRSHLIIYCTSQGPNQELYKAREPEKWMKEAVICLQEDMCEKIAMEYKIANHLLMAVRWSGIFTEKTPMGIEEMPRHDKIELVVRDMKKLVDWCEKKLEDFSRLDSKREFEKLLGKKPWERKEQILRELRGVNSWEELLTGNESNERVCKAQLKVNEEPEKATEDMLNSPTETKLEKWMEEAVSWLEKETEEKTKKDYDFAKYLLWEAHGTERSTVFIWHQRDHLKQVIIMESAIQKLARWCERKVNELSKLPLNCKLQEFKERKVQILNELPEMMKPLEIKEKETTFDKEVDETEATKDVLDSLIKDQDMVETKKTVEDLGEAYEMAKKLSDEAEEAFILADIEASFFRNLSEKQKKAIKKLADDWSDPHQ